MPVLGFDVYEGDGSVDWKAAHAAGARFAFVKVNEGDYLDPSTTSARVRAAKAAGFYVGAYDFLRPRPGRSGADEYAIFARKARSVGLLSHDGKTLRPVLDVEASGFNTATLAGRVATRRYIRSWVRACKKDIGTTPIIYTGYFWRDNLRNSGNNYGCPLWLASYGTKSQAKVNVPKAWDHASFWQYTEQGHLAGIKHAVDLNHYNGTAASLKHHLI